MLDSYGQIAAGKVIPFKADIQPRAIPCAVDPLQHEIKKFVTYEISGDSLAAFGCYDGDTIVCASRFHLSDIKRSSVCVVDIGGGELVAKQIDVDFQKKLVHLFSADGELFGTYGYDEIEVKSVACFFQRSFESQSQIQRHLSPRRKTGGGLRNT